MDNYSKTRLESEYKSRSKIREILLNLKNLYSIRYKKVAEFGCGLGENLKLFREDNSVVGYEILDDAIKHMVNIGIDARKIDLNQRYVESACCKYDFIMCLDVLEHLNDPKMALQSIKCMLNDDGMLVINVPNHFAFVGRIRVLLGSGIDSYRFFPECSEWNYPHIRFFSKKGILSLVHESGFEVHEDFSNMHFEVPFLKSNLINKHWIIKWISNKFPDLFQVGFLLVLKKSYA